MSTGTLLAYGITFFATIFAVTKMLAFIVSMPANLIGGLIDGISGRLTHPFFLISTLVGCIASWLFVNWLWLLFEGNAIPILALAVSFCLILIHKIISRDGLTDNSHRLMATEMWAIICVGGYLAFSSNPIRWI